MPEMTHSRTQPISRRQFLQISAAAGAVLAGGRWLARPQRVEIRETRVLMGTVINLALAAPSAAEGQAAVRQTFAEMERLILLFDHRRAASPLAFLNREGRLEAAPPELLELLALSLTYGQITGGAFDVTVKPLLDALAAGTALPETTVDYREVLLEQETITLGQPGMALTLDGIAKGRVVDAAVQTLQAQGFANILVEAGGDLFGRGCRADGSPWQVGVSHPRAAGRVLAAFTVSARAAATSGDYQNYFSPDFAWHHILDPHSRRSPEQLASVTVLAPTATDADALSTATMVLGLPDGLALLERLPHVEGLLVTRQMEMVRSSGFPT